VFTLSTSWIQLSRSKLLGRDPDLTEAEKPENGAFVADGVHAMEGCPPG
jgi:hypothetical protein